jgi:4-methyl-5(b-hydroxyethyl)-thiazole monophosphate biosynthesis
MEWKEEETMSKVLIPLAPGCEELEAVTIIDLLRRAGIEVVTAGLNPGPVTCSRQTVLVPDVALDDVVNEDFDMVVLPGGLPGADHLNEDPRIQDILLRTSQNGNYTAAICAAPKVLVSAGLLDGKTATAYPGVLDQIIPTTASFTGSPIEVDGKVITSRGPGTALDFALMLIEKLEGPNKRQEVELPLCR